MTVETSMYNFPQKLQKTWHFMCFTPGVPQKKWEVVFLAVGERRRLVGHCRSCHIHQHLPLKLFKRSKTYGCGSKTMATIMLVNPGKKANTGSYLVGGLEHFLFFHSVGNVIIPTDELIFFRWVGIPQPDDFFGVYMFIYVDHEKTD